MKFYMVLELRWDSRGCQGSRDGEGVLGLLPASSYLCCLQWRSLDEQQILAPIQRKICVLGEAHLCQLHSRSVSAIKKPIFHAILETFCLK